jgi:hypothetical protein
MDHVGIIVIAAGILATPAIATPVVWSTSAGGNGHAYEIVVSPGLSWQDAEALARSRAFQGYQGHLATISTAEENAFIQQLALSTPDAWVNYGAIAGPWLGGIRSAGSSVWKWTTGEVWNYSDWIAGEPNGGIESAQYLHYYQLCCAALGFGTIGWDDYRSPTLYSNACVIEYDVLTCDSQANLITNGNFESGAIGFGSDYVFSPSTGVPTGVFAVVNSPFPWNTAGPTFFDHTSGSGLMHLSNGSANVNHRVWYSSISVVPGQTYTFSFWAASWGNNGGVDPSAPRVRVEVDSQQIGSDFAVQASNGAWTQWSGAWTPTVSGSVVLSIRNVNAVGFGNDLALDDLALVSVATCPSSWQNLASTGPSPRWDGAAASDLARNQIVLFGGRSTDGLSFLGETWIWSGSSWTQRVVSGPSARCDTAMASLASGVILFGGRSSTGNVYLDDTWVWNGSAWILQNPATKPPARLGAKMVYDSARNRVVMFGGVLSGDTFAGDTWEWDGTNWTQVAGSGPAPRFGHHLSYDAQRQRTVMFGGALFFGTVFFDTWEWDGVSWEKRAEGGPSSQIYGAMAYDPGRQRAVYVTGYTFNRVFSSETWEWNGSCWSKSLSTAPPPRQNAYMAYDYQRSRMVLFGGYAPAGTLLGDTWGLVLGPSVISQPVSQSVRATQTALFSATGSSFGLQYRWLRNGVALNDGGNISGSETATLTISGVTAADAASYRVRVTDACGSQAISSPATLTVTCVADLNGDGYVDDPDFTLFVRAYDILLCPITPAPCPADFNLDGFVDDQDFQVFIVQYDELICP